MLSSRRPVAAAAPRRSSWRAALDRLIAGFRRFRQGYYEQNRVVFDALTYAGQAPRALVIACSDSRVDPQMIFSAAPGELFVVRNVASLVPPYEPDAAYHGTSAAVEFAIRALEVPDVVVMGHAGCGGVAALLREAESGPVGDFIGPWMSMARPARTRALAAGGDSIHTACEYETVKLSLANLLTFPWIKERVDAGRLRMHGAYFDIESGGLDHLQPDGSFRRL
jgi:carbonic anhydrase